VSFYIAGVPFLFSGTHLPMPSVVSVACLGWPWDTLLTRRAEQPLSRAPRAGCLFAPYSTNDLRANLVCYLQQLEA
jgi:hypothetical protein